MKLTLRQQITQFAHVLQTRLFPSLEEELGELSGSAKRLVATLEMIPLARFVPSSPRLDRPAVQGPAGDRQRLRGQGGIRVHYHQTVAGGPPAARATCCREKAVTRLDFRSESSRRHSRRVRLVSIHVPTRTIAAPLPKEGDGFSNRNTECTSLLFLVRARLTTSQIPLFLPYAGVEPTCLSRKAPALKA